jgi:PAS domain S-box-containing protein
LVVLLAGAWVVSLRRRVHSQVALIRQRLEREAALEQRFHSLLDSAHDMIFTVNPEGMLTSINRAGERVSGYTQEQLADTPLAALFEAESSVVEEAIRSAALEGSYWTADWAVVHKDQRRTQVEVTLQAIREGGQPAGILGISRDISDRKQAEQALLRARQLAGARDAAEQASRAKSAFLANMSHEIRTPLNAIMGYSQMLQEDCVRPEQQEMRADLRKIERAGQILLSLINDILDLSKIEAGRETVKPQNVDVAMVLEDVRNAVAPLAHERGNLLEIDCPAHARVVYADLAKFRQSLLNLVNNACKFTENGRVSIAVDRLRDSNGEWTEVHVSDTGIGIAPENLGKLFQPFSQVEGALTRKCNGTGLGLAISRKFCRLMAGDITVSSEVGRGSRFSIRLPAGKRESVREETEVLSVHDSVGRR